MVVVIVLIVASLKEQAQNPIEQGRLPLTKPPFIYLGWG